MAKISLRAYNREIEGLIEHGQQLDEAIAHCRHILKSYPKHLETYRLLGKAYLEAKRYDQAVDIFQRVLVAVPDDFVSHVGMSIIADDKGKLDDAIWHMERAFEVQPSNAAIQGELQRLFGRRDGLEPPKIRLTRGALAHMYVQGELYNQAISEIRAVLSNDPKRTDLQTLLARAYFRNGQKAEATDLCTELLSHYPYCLDANRLMVEILPGTQRADSVQEYRQRVNELDPYAAFVQDSVFRSESVADNLVSLERLEYTGENTESLGTLGIGLETDMTLTGRASGHAAESPRPPAAPAPRGASAGDLPAWLRGAPDEAGQNAAAPVAAPAVNANDLPDFLRQAGWDAASGDAVPQAPPAVAEQPADELPGGAAVEGDLPDWVKALAPADASQPRSEAAPASADTPDWLRNLGAEEPLQPSSVQETPPPAGDSPMPSAETPDWLKNLGGRELDEPAAPQAAQSDSDWLGSLRSEQASVPPPAAASEESPDWLRDFSNDLETPVMKSASPTPAAPQPLNLEPSANLGALGTTAQEQDDAMAWLEGLAAKHGAKPEELVTDPNARTEVAPDWVDRAKEMGEQSGEQAQASSDDETGMWLRGLEADATESSAFPETALGEPVEPGPADFRSGFADQNEFAATGAAPEKDELRGAGQEETPGWLGDFTPMPSTPLADDAPDWLRGISEGPVEPEQHLVEPPHGANAPTTRLPKLPTATGGLPAEEPHWEGKTGALPPWLAGLDKEEPILPPGGAGGQSSEDLPSWLQSEAEPEPEAKEPANPADWRPVQPEPYNVRQPTVTASTSAEGPVLPQPEPRRIERAPVPSPIPARPKPTSVAPKPAAVSLGDAQAQLGRGNIAAALDIYTRLIRKGKSLEDIIRDLRDALYRYPVEVPLWQSLGDAYMRANRLQEALDAYTKAEELLR